MAQLARSASIEQTLRALRSLALSPAFSLEMATVASYMGSGAFQPANLVDANGVSFNLNMDDEEFGPPSAWLPNSFAQVDITQAITPVPPYPRLQLLAAPGGLQAGSAIDTGQIAGWDYVIDVVTIAGADLASVAERQALALMDGYERLIRRNYYLGGLVELIEAMSPPNPGGSMADQSGNVAGVMQRFRVLTLRSIVA